MLNSKQILEEGLLKLENTQGKPAQIGYDLSLKEVNKVGINPFREEKIGMILKDKTLLTDYTPVLTKNVDGKEGWLLYPGTYDVTFHEGCKLPNNRTAFIRQRSSLLRNGAIIASSVFDPGFITENIGTIMIVTETIFIECGARIAQFYVHESTPVDETYEGQWQNDKQREL